MAKIKVLIEGYAKRIKSGWLASSTASLIIDYVLMTHYHPDHNYLCGIFVNAKALDDGLIYEKDKQTDLKILPTPGHEKFHASLVVPTKKGVVVIAGDVFWWSAKEKQNVSDTKVLLAHKDPFVKDENALKESRKRILEIADWIIPGHGKMFKNPKK